MRGRGFWGFSGLLGQHFRDCSLPLLSSAYSPGGDAQLLELADAGDIERFAFRPAECRSSKAARMPMMARNDQQLDQGECVLPWVAECEGACVVSCELALRRTTASVQGIYRPRMGRTVFRGQIEPIGLHSLHHGGGSGGPVDLPVHRLHACEQV